MVRSYQKAWFLKSIEDGRMFFIQPIEVNLIIQKSLLFLQPQIKGRNCQPLAKRW
jgi:hypothetical protein